VICRDPLSTLSLRCESPSKSSLLQSSDCSPTVSGNIQDRIPAKSEFINLSPARQNFPFQADERAKRKISVFTFCLPAKCLTARYRQTMANANALSAQLMHESISRLPRDCGCKLFAACLLFSCEVRVHSAHKTR
jgi:hypothetical protein